MWSASQLCYVGSEGSWNPLCRGEGFTSSLCSSKDTEYHFLSVALDSGKHGVGAETGAVGSVANAEVLADEAVDAGYSNQYCRSY